MTRVAIVFNCPECKARMQFKEIASHSWYAPDDPETQYIFGCCIGCGHPAIIGRVVHHRNDDGSVVCDDFPVYPYNKRVLTFSLPAPVQESYGEAIKCEAAKAPIAAVVMVRRTLEAVAKLFAPHTTSAFVGLEEIRKQGVISEELWRWANQLRFIGNIGAHPSEHKVSVEDMRDALDFLQAILETIFHYRPRFQDMERRRSPLPKKEEQPVKVP